MNLDIRIAEFAQLKQGRWFGGLPAALQNVILERSILRSYQRGETIVREGEPTKGLFGVLAGRVRVVRRVGEDHEALLHVAEAGYWFGEYALLAAERSLASLVASTAARLLVLPAAEFERLIAEEPRHLRPFMALVLDRFAYLHKYLAEAQSLAPQAWLATRLADLADIRRADNRVSGPVALAISQTELAEMVGVSRQTLNRLLAQLAARALIEVRFQRVVVLDEAGLRRISVSRSPD